MALHQFNACIAKKGQSFFVLFRWMNLKSSRTRWSIVIVYCSGCLTLAPSDLSIYALFFHRRMFAFAGSTRTRTSDVHLPCMQTEKLDRNDKQRRSTHRRKRQQNQMHMCDCAFALSVSAFLCMRLLVSVTSLCGSFSIKSSLQTSLLP